MWSCSRTNLLFQGRRQVKGGTRSSLSNIVSAGVRKRSQQYHAGNFHTRQPRVLNSCNRALLISKKTRHSIRRRLSTEASAAATSSSGDIPEPTSTQLRYVALAQVIPFIGFGFMDNAILIIAGDAIDTSLGVMLGISTMCAAAIGNIISDVAGVMLGTAIEDFVAKYLHLPSPNLTNAQRTLRSVRFANQFGCMVGIVIGCVIGMFPLLWIDPHKIDRMKREKHIETIFKDVVTEAKTLIGAESTCLYVRVNKGDGDGKNAATSRTVGGKPFEPASDGNYIYAMYRGVPTKSLSNNLGGPHGEEAAVPQPLPAPSSSTSSPPSSTSDLSTFARRISNRAGVVHIASDELLPLGRGIVSRAILTREPWNIYDVHSEPDFIAESKGLQIQQRHMKHMVVVPVLDGHGNAIAVIQGINKLSHPSKRGSSGSNQKEDSDSTSTITQQGGFTDRDVQILVALASHISVSLQKSMYQASDDDEEVRLRDTIRILKEQAEGISSDEEDRKQQRTDKRSKLRTTSYRRHRNLFPED